MTAAVETSKLVVCTRVILWWQHYITTSKEYL